MGAARIKLINKDTDLSSIKKSKLGWDVVLNDKPYQLYRIEGYIHTIGGQYGENEYWCCPLGEEPTFENLLEFNGHACCWGFKVEEYNYTRYKHGEGELCRGTKCEIYRNGEVVYELRGDINYVSNKAITLIQEIQEHPLSFPERDHINKEIIGRKIWWNDQPGVITRYIKDQGSVIIEPEEGTKFKALNRNKNEDWMNEYIEDQWIKEDIMSTSIYWFRGI